MMVRVYNGGYACDVEDVQGTTPDAVFEGTLLEAYDWACVQGEAPFDYGPEDEFIFEVDGVFYHESEVFRMRG